MNYDSDDDNNNAFIIIQVSTNIPIPSKFYVIILTKC